MKLARLLAVPAAALAIGAGLAVATAVGPASATEVTQDPQVQLDTLRSDTVAAQSSFTNQQSVDSAVAKVDDASTKLTVDKDADAVLKLQDYQTSLTSLATASTPKVDPDTAQRLNAEAQGIIDNINSTSTTSTSTTP